MKFVDTDSALSALNGPLTGQGEAAAKFLARTPPGDDRIATALRDWLGRWLDEHARPIPTSGPAVVDGDTGVKYAGTCKPTNPEACILALGIHGMPADAAVLERAEAFDASTLARCRLLGKMAPRQLVEKLLALFNGSGFAQVRTKWAEEEIATHAWEALLAVAAAAPELTCPALRAVLAEAQDTDTEIRLVLALMEIALPLSHAGHADPQYEAQRILGTISRHFPPGKLPRRIRAALCARGLPETRADIDDWLRCNPGFVSREWLCSLLITLRRGEPPRCWPGPLVEPEPYPSRFDYICPVCATRTTYLTVGAPSRDEEVDILPTEIRFVPRMELRDDFAPCRQLVDMIAEPWLSVDESQFCRACQPDISLPKRELVLRHDRATRSHRLVGIDEWDLQIIQELLGGSLVHHAWNGGTVPLKNFIPRLSELLGVAPPSEKVAKP